MRTIGMKPIKKAGAKPKADAKPKAEKKEKEETKEIAPGKDEE